MSDDIRKNRGADPDDRDVKELVRESRYVGRPHDAYRRSLLRELNHNFSQNARLTRGLLTVFAVVAACVVLFQTQELGGDVFDMIPKRMMANGDTLLEAPFSDLRMNVVPGGLTGPQVAEMLAAGMGEIVLVDAYTFDGKTRFGWSTRLTLNGITEDRYTANYADDPEEGRRIMAFFAAGLDANLEAIEKGELPPQGVKTVQFEGRDLVMRTWTWDFPGVGRMEFGRWEP